MPTFDLDIPRVQEARIHVDGAADEPAWAGALVLPELVTFAPSFDQAPTGRTTVRVMADDQGFYAHFVAEDPEPAKIRANLGRRDTRFSDDWCGFYLDPDGGAQRSYLFLANALGVQMDGTNVSGANEDIAWDGRWSSAGRRTEQGYEVEIAVPWSSVRHPENAEKMGLFVFRKLSRLGEKSGWPRLDPDVSGLIAQEAIVGGPGPLPRTVGVTLTPELTFGYGPDGPTTGGRLGWYGLSPGLTASYAPVAALQMVATVNPDFSQVEADADQIDLNRRNALYFEEKRPFFLEGQEWFAHPFGGLVYTRSMVAPYGGLRGTVEAGGWSAGALSVLDADPSPTVNEQGGWTEDVVHDRLTLESVARVRRSVGTDAYLGAVYSDRTLLDNGDSNRVAGADGRVRLDDHWSVTGAALGSLTTTDGVGTGFAPAGLASVSYGGKTLSVDVWGDYTHPAFRAENGYVPQTDRMGGGLSAGLELYPKSKLIPKIIPYPLQFELYTDTTGELRSLNVDPIFIAQLGDGTEIVAHYAYRGESFGGAWLGANRGELEVDTHPTGWLALYASGSLGTGAWYDPAAPDLGWQDSAYGQLTLTPVSFLSLTGSLTWEDFTLHGERAYEGFVARLDLEGFATRALSGRVILDRSSFEDRWGTSALLAWEPSPGSAVYLGGSRSTAPDQPTNWAVFAKASWVVAT